MNSIHRSIKKLNIGVFTSASNKLDSSYFELAKNLGIFLAKNGHSIIYGGAQIGMMGALADGALSVQGEVIGVFPKSLDEREIAHTKLSKLILTQGLHQRKETIYQMSDMFITLPGGFGTLDETFEVLTWNQLGHITKPLYFFNDRQFFDQLIRFIHQLEQSHFIKVYDKIGLNTFNNLEDLEKILYHNIKSKYDA